MRDTITITITPLTLRLKVCLPRLYGLRLRLVGWLMTIAGKVAGDLMAIEVEVDDDDGNFKPDPRQPTKTETPPPPKKGN